MEKIKLDSNNWRDIPHLRGRVATQEDIESGIAIFRIDMKGIEGEHCPIDLDIPALAWLTDAETSGKKLVVITQAEWSNGNSVVAYIDFNNEIGAGTLNEFEIIENPDSIVF